MPLQSKVNDVLMDVLITRVVERVREEAQYGEQAVDETIKAEGTKLGFTIRVEQFWRGKARTLVDALDQQPFLFIGYYFHYLDGRVVVAADLPRTLAQVPYPSQKWHKSRGELLVKEAMRVGCIALNLGIPPAAAQAAVSNFRAEAIALIKRALRLPGGDEPDPKLRWAIQASAWAEVPEPSLSGLLRALERTPESLWDVAPALPTPRQLATAWADIIEEEENARAAEVFASLWRPAQVERVAAVRLRAGVETTHPATLSNDGRQPPTAVWQPDRPPRATGEGSSGRAHRRWERRALAGVWSELETVFESDSEYSDQYSEGWSGVLDWE
jgi:hypothetical protein